MHSLLTSDELEKEFSELLNDLVALFNEHHYHVLSEIIFGLNSVILRVIVNEQVDFLLQPAVRLVVFQSRTWRMMEKAMCDTVVPRQLPKRGINV